MKLLRFFSHLFLIFATTLISTKMFAKEISSPAGAGGGKIVGGSVVSDGRYPYMVALSLARHKPYCGGVLISSRAVLTAGHCIDPKYAEMDCVNLEDCTVIRVDYSVRHPSYNENNYKYDIKIVFLREDAPASVVSSIPLIAGYSWSSIPSGTDMTIIGWGATYDGGSRTDNLREAEVDLVSLSSCRDSYRFTFENIHNYNLCAFRPGKDTCTGDSGGPLLVACENGDDVIVGITSWGMACGSSYPAVYTEVSYFHSWIETKLKEFDANLVLQVAPKCNGEIVPEPSPTPFPTRYPTPPPTPGSGGGGFWCFWGFFC